MIKRSDLDKLKEYYESGGSVKTTVGVDLKSTASSSVDTTLGLALDKIVENIYSKAFNLHIQLRGLEYAALKDGLRAYDKLDKIVMEFMWLKVEIYKHESGSRSKDFKFMANDIGVYRVMDDISDLLIEILGEDEYDKQVTTPFVIFTGTYPEPDLDTKKIAPPGSIAGMKSPEIMVDFDDPTFDPFASNPGKFSPKQKAMERAKAKKAGVPPFLEPTAMLEHITKIMGKDKISEDQKEKILAMLNDNRAAAYAKISGFAQALDKANAIQKEVNDKLADSIKVIDKNNKTISELKSNKGKLNAEIKEQQELIQKLKKEIHELHYDHMAQF